MIKDYQTKDIRNYPTKDIRKTPNKDSLWKRLIKKLSKVSDIVEEEA